MTKSPFVPVLIALGLIVGGLTLIKTQIDSSVSEREHHKIEVGQDVPNFDLIRLDDQKSSFADLGKKVVLINFWATWCEACLVEMPSIIKLKNRFGPEGFEVLAVTVDENPNAVVPKYEKKLNFNFPVYKDIDQKLSDLFDVHAIPLSVILDQSGKILLIQSGEEDWFSPNIQSQMKQWLAQSNAKTPGQG